LKRYRPGRLHKLTPFRTVLAANYFGHGNRPSPHADITFRMIKDKEIIKPGDRWGNVGLAQLLMFGALETLIIIGICLESGSLDPCDMTIKNSEYSVLTPVLGGTTGVCIRGFAFMRYINRRLID